MSFSFSDLSGLLFVALQHKLDACREPSPCVLEFTSCRSFSRFPSLTFAGTHMSYLSILVLISWDWEGSLQRLSVLIFNYSSHRTSFLLLQSFPPLTSPVHILVIAIPILYNYRTPFHSKDH
jgi:hypothetical protein